MRQAKDAGLAGLVATVDTDTDHSWQKLKDLEEAREQERSKLPPFPTVLAQADPHGEAWLLDDAMAVRLAFGFPGNAHIVNVRQTKDPKEELEALKRRIKAAGPTIPFSKSWPTSPRRGTKPLRPREGDGIRGLVGRNKARTRTGRGRLR